MFSRRVWTSRRLRLIREGRVDRLKLQRGFGIIFSVSASNVQSRRSGTRTGLRLEGSHFEELRGDCNEGGRMEANRSLQDDCSSFSHSAQAVMSSSLHCY